MDDFLGKRAFDIADMPENIDLDSPPVTGFDYLYRVHLESKKCPKVVVSNIDTAQFINHQTVKIDFCNGFIRAPPDFQPDVKWQEGTLNLFTRTRDKFLTHHNVLKTKFPKREFPDINKREEWCIYCLGYEKYEQMRSKNTDDDTDPENTPKRKKARIIERNPPLLSIMLYLRQNAVIKLLKYHIDWLKSIKFTRDQAEWIYALLLSLQKPLDPDTCDLLRSLSRVCSGLRSDLKDPEDESLKPLNMLITIISRYFDQRDMSDDFHNEASSSKKI